MDIISSLVETRLMFEEFPVISAYRLDGEDPGENKQNEVLAEIYPGLPQHTANERFYADRNTDPGEIKSCTKIYPEASGITGGLGHITC